MEQPGNRLKRVREKLGLTYRDVEQLSHEIAERRGNPDFSIALSRLADIENKGTVPTIYRLYTLCAIYRLDFDEVLGWYGVPRDQLPAEALQVGLQHTHAVRFEPPASVPIPAALTGEIDLSQTTLLSHLIRNWGKASFSFLNGLDLRQFRYGFIGLEDWSMYPILHPGSLIVID